MTRLDVGCGSFPTGDVNCDLYPTEAIGLGHRHGHTMDPKQIKNFVMCDGRFLPFPDHAFNVVFCGGTIEHTNQPFRLFAELSRVTKNRVIVTYPNRFGDKLASITNKRAFGWNKKHHISVFNNAWFNFACQKTGLSKPSIGILRNFIFPSKYLPWLVVPWEMILVAEKGENTNA